MLYILIPIITFIILYVNDILDVFFEYMFASIIIGIVVIALLSPIYIFGRDYFHNISVKTYAIPIKDDDNTYPLIENGYITYPTFSSENIEYSNKLIDTCEYVVMYYEPKTITSIMLFDVKTKIKIKKIVPSNKIEETKFIEKTNPAIILD